MFSKGRERDFIFIHLPRTGGGSIKNHLIHSLQEERSKLDYPRISKKWSTQRDKFYDSTDKHPVYHGTLKDYEDTMGEESYRNAYRFTSVRNPWERVVSLYCFFKSGTPEEDYKKTLSLSQKRIFSKKQLPRGGKGKNNKENTYATFDIFIENISTFRRQNPWPFFEYSHYFKKEEMDFIIRFENFQSDFLKVCSNLDLKNINLLDIHRTSHDHYSTYYNNKSKDIIYKIFKKDIVDFNYEFEKV